MATWVCLLRGVNLGARNRVSMPQLRDVVTAAGFAQVQTYLQSGNLVVRCGHTSPDRVGELVRRVVRQQLGLDVPVVVRSPDRLRDVLTWCPFPDAAARPTATHVLHLVADPEPERVAALLAQDWGPDRLAARNREVVLQYAGTMHDSRLSHAAILRRLAVDGTARNWRTLQALVELTADDA